MLLATNFSPKYTYFLEPHYHYHYWKEMYHSCIWRSTKVQQAIISTSIKPGDKKEKKKKKEAIHSIKKKRKTRDRNFEQHKAEGSNTKGIN